MGVDLFPSASVPDPFIGRTLNGRYDVLARLGVGGIVVQEVLQGRRDDGHTLELQHHLATCGWSEPVYPETYVFPCETPAVFTFFEPIHHRAGGVAHWPFGGNVSFASSTSFAASPYG